MNYELAKELKEAGLPQDNGSEYFIPEDIEYDDGYNEKETNKKSQNILVTKDVQSFLENGILFVGDYENDNYKKYSVASLVRKPTLEELIEACGHSFVSLEYNQVNEDKWKWTASAWKNDEPVRSITHQTPSETVAKLWLSLNKKLS